MSPCLRETPREARAGMLTALPPARHRGVELFLKQLAIILWTVAAVLFIELMMAGMPDDNQPARGPVNVHTIGYPGPSGGP